jgi:hypothetical protein
VRRIKVTKFLRRHLQDNCQNIGDVSGQDMKSFSLYLGYDPRVGSL